MVHLDALGVKPQTNPKSPRGTDRAPALKCALRRPPSFDSDLSSRIDLATWADAHYRQAARKALADARLFLDRADAARRELRALEALMPQGGDAIPDKSEGTPW